MKEKASELLRMAQKKSPVEGLFMVAELFPGKVVFTTSFGIEDQVITDMICTHDLDIRLATLDTGRHFKETYKVHSRTLEKYKTRIETYYPHTASVEKLVSDQGPYSFYESVENRKECCYIRKVEPLDRALKNMECWITGIRAEQSPERTDRAQVESDEDRGLFKYHPLFSWSLAEVEQYVAKNNVPINVLHHKGYVSIGCAPCTRALGPGEDFRAGRWWWESDSKKECGLHIPDNEKNK